MKDYIVPYIVGENGPWWGGVDIYNHNDTDQAVVIKVYRHGNGVRTNVIETTIKKFEHYLLLKDEIMKDLNVGKYQDGRAHIIVTGPENLMLTAMLGIKDPETNNTVGYGILPIHTDTTLKN